MRRGRRQEEAGEEGGGGGGGGSRRREEMLDAPRMHSRRWHLTTKRPGSWPTPSLAGPRTGAK
eukprot:6598185-Pyramimonas_sp.AAC.1